MPPTILMSWDAGVVYELKNSGHKEHASAFSTTIVVSLGDLPLHIHDNINYKTATGGVFP